MKVDSARARIAEVFADGRPIWIALSGGKDSLAVVDLCKDYAGRFKLLWANQGYNFPHVESHIRALADLYGMHEIRMDLMAHWEKYGVPAEVAPAHNWIPGAICKSPKVQPWTGCCLNMISIPMREFLIAGEPSILLHGQKFEDGAPNNGPDGWGIPHCRIMSPIDDWSTRDVVNYLVENKVSVPAHYGRVHTSLDCWICPAMFSLEHGAKRMAYMRDEHPEMLEQVLPLLRMTTEVAQSAIDEIISMTEGANGRPS